MTGWIQIGIFYFVCFGLWLWRRSEAKGRTREYEELIKKNNERLKEIKHESRDFLEKLAKGTRK